MTSTGDGARKALADEARFVNCETCRTEGRILTNDGGPDDVDHGECPDCKGQRVVEVETKPITLEDLNQCGETHCTFQDDWCKCGMEG